MRSREAARATSELRPDGHMRVELETPRGAYAPVTLSLRGRHQLENALTTVVLLEAMEGCGLAVPQRAVETGLTGTRWPGRLEPFVLDNRQILFDGAHNPAGARALATYVLEMHPGRPPVVFAAMRDKYVSGMLAALAPAVSAIVATEVHNPRTLPATTLGILARAAAPRAREEVVPDPDQALAKNSSGFKPNRI